MLRVWVKNGGRDAAERFESELQNAIEILRDPSHVRMLPGSELSSLVKDAGFDIEKQTTWDKPREFEEWMGIVNDASRAPPPRARWCGRWPTLVCRPESDCRWKGTRSGFSTAGI